ncbi:hypothetical protein [Anaeromassilibacillus sp. SJQ-1]|uniref:hypothetical protein n=1 Tax=Anaeromassilibacillus sp. SJQ-1 TaxID=3375419 RepID=UPI003989A093
MEFRVYFDDDSANLAFESGAMRPPARHRRSMYQSRQMRSTITLYVDELAAMATTMQTGRMHSLFALQLHRLSNPFRSRRALRLKPEPALKN